MAIPMVTDIMEGRATLIKSITYECYANLLLYLGVYVITLTKAKIILGHKTHKLVLIYCLGWDKIRIKSFGSIYIFKVI